MRITLCSSAALALGAWLALGAVEMRSGSFLLEVPASYLSVGQQFQPRLVATGVSDPDTVDLELDDAAGRRVATATALVSGDGVVAAPPMSLPQPGAYRLKASDDTQTRSIELKAMADPPAGYGGVLAMASWGLPEGAADYLRQHGFAIDALDGEPMPAVAPQTLLLGDPRLGGAGQADEYAAFWKTVADGANALLLQPPPPGMAEFWPLNSPLAPPQGGCSDDLTAPPLNNGLAPSAFAALRPALVYNLLDESSLDLYHWDGTRLDRPNRHSGYPGCHAVFSFRYGDGWVTVSTLPLLQQFQDVRARLLLMNLIQAVARRKRVYVPPSPGLAWVLSRRIEQARHLPPNPLRADAALWYEPPPAAIAPTPVLVPVSADSSACWRAPQAGGTLRLDLVRPQPVAALSLKFGAALPASLALEASADGVHWSPLPFSPPPGANAATVPLPAAQRWEAFRLELPPAASSAGLPQVCAFSAQ